MSWPEGQYLFLLHTVHTFCASWNGPRNQGFVKIGIKCWLKLSDNYMQISSVT